MTTSRIVITQGASFARDTLIDFCLSPAETAKVYELWQPDWPEPYAHQGNERSILLNQVLEVGFERLSEVYGKKLAGKMIRFASENTIF